MTEFLAVLKVDSLSCLATGSALWLSLTNSVLRIILSGFQSQKTVPEVFHKDDDLSYWRMKGHGVNWRSPEGTNTKFSNKSFPLLHGLVLDKIQAASEQVKQWQLSLETFLLEKVFSWINITWYLLKRVFFFSQGLELAAGVGLGVFYLGWSRFWVTIKKNA